MTAVDAEVLKREKAGADYEHEYSSTMRSMVAHNPLDGMWSQTMLQGYHGE
jgi:hypothetical protein